MTYLIVPLHPNAKDISGQTFGRLTAIACVGKNSYGLNHWLCICSCGTETVAMQKTLASGKTRSCGCLADELFKINCIDFDTTIHGFSGTVEHKAWKAMHDRCNNPNSHNYLHYGGRGISVCVRWDSFENFYTDMGNRPKSKTSIDRIDNDGDYTPENCRWATQKQQMRKTRNNYIITHAGKTRCLAEWSEVLNVRYGLLATRIFTQGWSDERALTEPINPRYLRK